MRRSVACIALGLLVVGACGGTQGSVDTGGAPPSSTSTSTTASSSTTAVPTTPPTSAEPPDPPAVEVALRFEDRTGEHPELAEEAQATLTDPRGWQQAGFGFTFDDAAPYVVVLAEAAEVDALCSPYDTEGLYSCQIGSTVALNADRWRSATPEWPGSLEGYRQMLVNHEVGHLLGQHHPDEKCPVPGDPAPVMAQQSKGADGCTANPWPLPWELACAAEHVEPLAPGYEADATPTCGPGG
jgi:hypothetical protein